MDRIALAVDKSGKLSDYMSIEEIVIYEKNAGWNVIDAFRIDDIMGLDEINNVRMKAEQIAGSLKDRSCNILVSKEIVGIPYYSLSRAGLEVLEADEISNELFEDVYNNIINKKVSIEKLEDYVVPSPIPCDDEGNFYLDFIKASKYHPDISSKKMLIPFFEKERFFSLLVSSDHVMPWLKEYTALHDLNMEVMQEQGVYKILVSHKCCND